MIQVVLRVLVPPDKPDEVLQVFSRLSGATEVTKGCRHCRILRDANDDNAILYWAQWDTREDLEVHLRSERFHKLLPYVEMSLEPSEVDVSNMDRMGGMEFVLSALREPQQ